MTLDNNQQAFFALVRGGLWENDVQLAQFGSIDFKEVYRLAQEQAVVGLVAAGLEHVIDIKVPPVDALIIAGDALELEQTNTAMNKFIASLVEQLREAGIYAVLVKGQGIAQCYERPQWRTCGDIDLLLSDRNYKVVKDFLSSFSFSLGPEGKYEKHFAMAIDSWIVELHGTLRSGLSRKIDKELDAVMESVIYGGKVRSWINDKIQLFLPSAENDAIFVFSHILQHFYKGGIGLRQICDWCRLLWHYQQIMNLKLVETRIRQMDLMSEWKVFGAFVVEYLGMPSETMPFYVKSKKRSRKAKKIGGFILEVGNFGHNRDMSYYTSKPYLIRKVISLRMRFWDLIKHSKIFPMDSLRFFPRIIINGLRAAVNGE